MTDISRTFRCFDEVARRGSIRKAAETLHLTPAAVQQRIANLERQVGIPLFDRLPRGMQLSAAGELMLASVRRCQRDFDNAVALVEELRSLRRGHIHLAVSSSSAEVLVGRVVAATLRTHPGISYQVRTGSGEEIVRWVAGGEADIGYCLARETPPDVAVLRTFDQQLGAVFPPGHALDERSRAAPGGLRLRDCLDHPLILMAAGTELRAMVTRIGGRERRPIRPLIESTSVPLVRQMVAAGAGIGLLIPENVADDVAAGRLVWRGLADTGARSTTCIYQRRGQVTPAAVGLFLQHFEAAILELQQATDTASPAPDAPLS